MTDELMNKLQLGGEPTREQFYKLREPPHIIHRHESTKSNFLIEVVLNPTTGIQMLNTKGLLDSGGTSSASTVEKH